MTAKTLLLTLSVCAIACALPTTALAGKGNKKNAAAGGAAGAGVNKEERKEKKAIFTKYDKNNDGVLDADEKAAIKKDFDTDSSLKVLDTDKDGKLSDAEVDALKAPHHGAGKKGAAKPASA